MEKISFQTHGCSANMSESEAMAGMLQTVHFDIAKHHDSADIVVLSVCTVKGEDSMLAEYKKLREQYPQKKIILAGCVTEKLRRLVRAYDSTCSIMNTDNMHRIVEVVEETINDNPIEIMEPAREDKVGLPRVRFNPHVGIVPILNSCRGSCTFCSTKIVKGALKSYPEEKILDECRLAVRKGCTEIWLTSQDNACYMMEYGKSKLADLIIAVANISGDFRIRVGMANPEHILPIMDQLIEAMKHEKVYKFLHIPVQSGSNAVLKKMRRMYTVEQFSTIVHTFRASIPSITIATDIICGFPSESIEEFDHTVALIRELTPEVCNISRYRIREGTKAAAMEQVDADEIKNRSTKVSRIFDNISMMNHERWYGWEGDVLITGRGSLPGQMIGRNNSYLQVLVNGEHPVGEWLAVKIIKTGKYDMTGQVLQKKPQIAIYT